MNQVQGPFRESNQQRQVKETGLETRLQHHSRSIQKTIRETGTPEKAEFKGLGLGSNWGPDPLAEWRPQVGVIKLYYSSDVSNTEMLPRRAVGISICGGNQPSTRHSSEQSDLGWYYSEQGELLRSLLSWIALWSKSEIWHPRHHPRLTRCPHRTDIFTSWCQYTSGFNTSLHHLGHFWCIIKKYSLHICTVWVSGIVSIYRKKEKIIAVVPF